MRIVSLTVIGFIAFTATAAVAQPGAPGWPSSSPRASYAPSSAMSSLGEGARQLTAQRAASMINSGHCKGALRMAQREGEYKLADRIVDVCRVA
jgi:hypothetical protein